MDGEEGWVVGVEGSGYGHGDCWVVVFEAPEIAAPEASGWSLSSARGE